MQKTNEQRGRSTEEGGTPAGTHQTREEKLKRQRLRRESESAESQEFEEHVDARIQKAQRDRRLRRVERQQGQAEAADTQGREEAKETADRQERARDRRRRLGRPAADGWLQQIRHRCPGTETGAEERLQRIVRRTRVLTLVRLGTFSPQRHDDTLAFGTFNKNNFAKGNVRCLLVASFPGNKGRRLLSRIITSLMSERDVARRGLVCRARSTERIEIHDNTRPGHFHDNDTTTTRPLLSRLTSN